jgi:hypothetical protein
MVTGLMSCSEKYISSFSQSYKPELRQILVIGSCLLHYLDII